MHYSRVSVSSNSQVYSAASAVLLVEVLKCGISFAIALMRTKPPPTVGRGYDFLPASPTSPMDTSPPYLLQPNPQSGNYRLRLQSLISEIGSADAWKLSIPALLYVLQNNLQYIAVSNLDVPTFQVTNQMKILTTAGFSVPLLHRKLSKRKWASLALLAIGVGIVQIQAAVASPETSPTVLPSSNVYSQGGDTVDPVLPSASTLRPLTGFLAVSAACFTSGLAGVYFEMVLKGWSDFLK
jgi:solute carrier family 35 (UDP-sugar transporter), member A1/2/3